MPEEETASSARSSYHQLAFRLRRDILSGAIADGAVLPNERDLGCRSGLSRGSVREALRILEMEGFILTRRGRNGGSVVQRPGSASVSRTLQTFVQGQGLPFDTVLEAREAIEPALAGLAALHREPSDLEEMAAASAALAASGDQAGFVAANTRWHRAIAEASHNPVLTSIVAALGDLLHRSNVERFISAQVRVAVVRAHARIEAAIRAGDMGAAQRRMARHVHSYRQQVAPMAPAMLGLEP